MNHDPSTVARQIEYQHLLGANWRRISVPSRESERLSAAYLALQKQEISTGSIEQLGSGKDF